MTTLKRYTGTDWEQIGLPSNVGMSPQTLGYAEKVTDQTGITTTTDITGLSVTVTVPAGRRIRVRGFAHYLQNTTASIPQLWIREGSTLLQTAITGGAVAEHSTVAVEWIGTPSAGTHTYKLTAWTGAGTLNVEAAADDIAFILVEDITGSTLPYQPASVPVGQLAYAQVTASQGSITTLTDLTGLSVNVAVPAGRVLRITAYLPEVLNNTADRGGYARIIEDGVNVGQGDSSAATAADGQQIVVTTIRSPAAGAHVYKVALAPQGAGTVTNGANAAYPCFLLVEDITPTPAPSSGAPGSTLGYAEITASQPAYTALTDVAGLSVTVTVPAGRRLRVTGKTLTQFSVTNELGDLSIYEGGTRLNVSRIVGVSGKNIEHEVEHILTPSAGTHTYKLATVIETGSGTMTVIAGATNPAFILVEDITGSVWPAGSAVTVGMIASEAWTEWVPTLTNLTLGNGTLIAKYQKIGRTVHWRFRFVFGSSGSAVGTGPQFTLPVPVHSDYSDSGQEIMGSAVFRDAGVAGYNGQVYMQNTAASRATFSRIGGSGSADVNVTATAPFTWAVGDMISAMGTYEAAA